MKTNRVLLTLLAGSLALNAFTFLTGFQQQVQCPELPSYTNSQEISLEDATRAVDTYKNSVPAGTVTGGIITGNTIEDIFCATGTNALAYALARDPSGTIASGGVFVVLEGADVTVDNKGKITQVRKTGTKLFRPNNWCPPNCVPLN